jgi:signal transduction histidine kinase
MWPDMPAALATSRSLLRFSSILTGNAIKFTDTGEVAIKVAAAQWLVLQLRLKIQVPGISAADQEKLFQQFQQADNSITKSKGGTGLGLAISKRITTFIGAVASQCSPASGKACDLCRRHHLPVQG